MLYFLAHYLMMVSIFWWDLELGETICFTKNHFSWSSLFQLLGPLGKWLLPLLQSAKQRLVLKEWSGILLALTMCNKGCLLLIIYKVCIGDVLQNWLLWFSLYVLPCDCWHHIMTVVYVVITTVVMMFFVDDDFNKGYIHIKIYELLIGNDV